MKSGSTIILRITEVEKDLAKSQADKLGFNLSDYIRWLINLDAGSYVIPMIQKDIIDRNKKERA